MKDILQWTLIILSIPVLAMLVVHTIKRARSLSQRIDDYHAEQDSGNAANPYEDMAKIFGPQNGKDKQ